LVLPVVAAVMARLAVGLKLTRVTMLEVLGEPYIRTARSKGLPGLVVILRHGLRNALIPIITTLGLQFSALLGGTVIVEVVFAWPGIGRYALGSIRTLDFPAIMSVTVVLAAVFLVINMIVDILYVALDPRIRYA
jgi:peptide/nickel transport system permease protein